MKSNLRSFFIAAGIAGAVFLVGAAALLILKYRNRKKAIALLAAEDCDEPIDADPIIIHITSGREDNENEGRENEES